MPPELSTAGLLKGSDEWRERKRAYLAWYASQPENIERRTRVRHAYRSREEVRQLERDAARLWHAANTRKSEDPDARASRRAANKALRKGARVERVMRSKLWTRDGGMCSICGLAADPRLWDIDHIVPISKGGKHSYANTAVSHPVCNRRKHDHDPREPGSPYAFLLRVARE